MKWKKYSIETTKEAEDFLMGVLQDLPVGGIEIQDKKKPTKEEALMLGDYIDELPEDDGLASVSFYIELNQNSEEIFEVLFEKIEFMKSFIDFGTLFISEEISDDEEWIDNWKKYFKSFKVEDCWVIPSWEEVPELAKEEMMIRIDPGVAFGTGTHESTQLAMKHMNMLLKEGDKVLDIGCGSGILSIIALKKGARYADCIDIDELALNATRENMEVNDLSRDLFATYQGDITSDENLQKSFEEEDYEIIFSNILAEIIIPMIPFGKRYLKTGGYYITSGIISHKEEDVKKALEDNGLEIISIQRQGEWVSIVARRNG